eukprot:scaffold48138_cov76-Cyclotella_meneghiniana.AAC.5
MGARWFLIGFDRRGLIARLSEFFWTRDWNPPLFGLDPLLSIEGAICTLNTKISGVRSTEETCIGAGCILSILDVKRRRGGGHSSSGGADVVVQSEAIALVEGPGAGEETRRKAVAEVETMDGGDGWVPALLWRSLSSIMVD